MQSEFRMCVLATCLKIAEFLWHIQSVFHSFQMWDWGRLLCSKMNLPNVKQNLEAEEKRTKGLGWEQ